MKKILLTIIGVVATPAFGVIVAQAQSPAVGPRLAAPLPGQTSQESPQAHPVIPKRPASVPPDYRVTPFGYFHPSCVVRLAKGDELRARQGVIKHADGTNIPMHKCDYPRYSGDGQALYGDRPAAAKDPNISHSWIVSESVTTSTSSYGSLSAEWSVPPNPASNDGQTLFYFPGMEDINDVVTIIQPVLGWNSDYSSAWGIASWNCCENGTTYEATPQQVNAGDTILGYMFETCGWGVKSCGTWDIVTWDLQNGKFSELLATSSFGQTFNWAFGGVLEVYNIAQCSDYPNNPNGFTGGTHDISFNEIGLYDYNGAAVKPVWQRTRWATGLSPQCQYNASAPDEVLITD